MTGKTDNLRSGTKTILAADIGGTNSRFAFFSSDADGNLTLISDVWLKTTEAKSFADLLESLKLKGFPLNPEAADIVGIAIAGPIEQNVRSSPPLIPWSVDISRYREEFGLKRVFLINDFVAQAYSCLSPVGKAAREILAGSADEDATVAVIGAGTGLGKALLVPDSPGSYRVLPSEGAHADFPFVTSREYEFMEFLTREKRLARVTCNHVVSGSGLRALHQFLTGERLDPREVAESFAAYPETLSWASRFYGRACRNFTLETLALGGLYIAGGIAAKNPGLLTHDAFTEEFYASDTMGQLLRNIPVRLIEDQNSGLWGVAVMAAIDLSVRGEKQHG
ncbi:MAG: glucokinase [Thermodesulfovibrionales bacterium]|jgi:glucokinase